MSLQGEVALVTGASRGIGRAVADELGRLGATVIGTATTTDGAARIEAYLHANGVHGTGIALDVTNPEAIEAAVKSVEERFGAPGILVNNAGVTRDTLMMRMKDEDWHAVIDTNLTSIFRMSRACLRGMMKARKGRIINIASVVAVTGNAGQTNYGAAKAGIIGFSKSLAREIATRGITVNVVAPGFIDTDMTRGLGEAQHEQLLQQIPAGRLGRPEEVAASVGFLASPGAAYITGETIHVNGGMYMA